jgi:hypothetical protein
MGICSIEAVNEDLMREGSSDVPHNGRFVSTVLLQIRLVVDLGEDNGAKRGLRVMGVVEVERERAGRLDLEGA